MVTAIDTIAVTILLSVIAHGITARPIAGRYVRTLSPRSGETTGPGGSQIRTS